MTLPGAVIMTRHLIGPWASAAACLGRDPALWHPPVSPWARPDPRRRVDPYQAARAICWAECPVRSECLAYALAAAEPLGMWGGLDPDERAQLAARPLHTVRARSDAP